MRRGASVGLESGRFQFARLHQADLDQVQGMDPVVTHRYATGAGDGIPQGRRPEVLDERNGGRAAIGKGVTNVPGLVLIEEVTVCSGLLACARAGLHARLAVQADADERTDKGSHAFGLLEREVTPLDAGELPVLALLDDQG